MLSKAPPKLIGKNFVAQARESEAERCRGCCSLRQDPKNHGGTILRRGRLLRPRGRARDFVGHWGLLRLEGSPEHQQQGVSHRESEATGKRLSMFFACNLKRPKNLDFSQWPHIGKVWSTWF